MCAKSKESNKDLHRPFGKEVWNQAKQLADSYQLVMFHEEDYWHGHGMELPLVMGGGNTPDECAKDTLEALTAAVATMLERGEVPPIAATEGKRTEQVNVRLSVEEKAVLAAAAQSRGFKGLGDYMRSTALSAK